MSRWPIPSGEGRIIQPHIPSSKQVCAGTCGPLTKSINSLGILYSAGFVGNPKY